MSQLNFGINLITKTKKIEEHILKALLKEIKIKLPPLKPKITKIARGLIGKYIKMSPEYLEFTSGGVLYYELGVSGQSTIDDLIAILANTVTVQIKNTFRRSGQISGGLTLKATPEGFINMVQGMGVYTSENGHTVPWLQWLLTAGSEPILKDYRIQYGGKSSVFSRTGGPIMRKGSKGWSIPPQFSGTSTNNFVTRAMDMLAPELEQNVRQLVLKALK